MNYSWEEQFRNKIYRSIKKQPEKKVFLTVYLYFVVMLYRTMCYFRGNSKRFFSAGVVLLFCCISTSFSFENEVVEETVVEESPEEWIEIQDSYEYVPTKLIIAKSDLIDDDDVISGYNNDELYNDENIDQFSIDEILNENVGYISSGVDENEQLSKDDWNLVLVNKQHPVPKDYIFTLGKITGSMECDERILDELFAMLKAAKDDGVELVICSPYRDYNRQTVLFNRKIDYYMGKGYSYMEAYKISSITVTVPGASEHQIGLALDIVSDTYSSLDTGFGNTEAGIWLRENGSKYGFILRYPLGKEYITGIQYEPWHFRYVGKTAATSIMRRGITLEEFLEDLD